MVNLSTSQFPDAYTLDGSELIGIVQNGNNCKATLGTVNGLIADKSYVRLGQDSYTEGGYSIAVGANSRTFNKGLAVGYYAYAFNDGAAAVGKYSYSTAQHGVAIGTSAYAAGYRGVAIGFEAQARTSQSIAIGSNAYIGNGEASIAIGGAVSARGASSIAIGYGVDIPSTYSDQIAIGNNAFCDSYSSIAIGTRAEISGGEGGVCRYNIAIGHNARASTYYNIAIGYRANFDTSGYVGKTTVVGHRSAAYDWYATAIGYDCRAGYYGVAVGTYTASNAHGVAIGTSVAIGYHAIAIGDSGAFGNDSIALGRCYTPHDYAIAIGMNVASAAIGEFTARGAGQYFSMAPTQRQQRFVGHTTNDNQTVVLTADGNAPTSGPNNLPAIPTNTMARMTATVVGHGGDIVSFDPTQTADYESACFLMSPALVICYSDGTYEFIGDGPAFTMENSTDGASGWDPPVINVVNTNTLHITVTNSATVVDWICFVTFEAGS